MFSFHKIRAGAATLTVGVLLAIAFAATAQAGGAHGLTAQQSQAVLARAQATDRYYHLGRYSPAVAAKRAEERRSQAANRYYRLGQ